MSLQKPSQDMLYRYTQRKLSEEEETQVELWLMDNPDALEAVRLDEALLGHSRRVPNSSAGHKLFAWRFVAGIAGVVMIVALVASFREIGALQEQIAQLRAPDAGVEVIALTITRGTQAEPTPIFTNVPVVLRVPTELFSSQAYDLAMYQQGKPVAEWKGLRADGSATLNVLVPSGTLDAGKIVLEVTGSEGFAERFELDGSQQTP